MTHLDLAPLLALPPPGAAAAPPPLAGDPARLAEFATEAEAKRVAAELSEADLPPGFVVAYQRAKEFAAQWQDRYHAQRRQHEELTAMAEAQARARAVHVCSRLYVGGVGYELSGDDLAKVFEPFGHVKNVDMTLDPLTGRHKGFCFVEYDAPEAAVAALGVLNGVMLGAPRARGRGGRQGTPGAPGRGRTQGC